MSHKMRNVQRNIARAVQKKADAAQAVTIRSGTITAVSVGTGSDGHDVASVNINGSVVQAPYLSGYTPVPLDVVRVLLIQGAPLILGKPIGFLSF